METKKKRNFLLRVDWTNWYSSRADIVQGSKSSLNFVRGVKRTEWIDEGSKIDFFLSRNEMEKLGGWTKRITKHEKKEKKYKKTT